MHNGFITIKDDKMSKSLGNFILIHDLLKEFNVEVIRYFMLKTHYRSPLNYNSASLQETKEVVDKIYHILQKQAIVVQNTELSLYEIYELLNGMEVHEKFIRKIYTSYV